jgi:hypothetical protein
LDKKPLGSDYISNQFSNLFNAYAKSINKVYGRTGSLFQHPFGRVPITSDRQFWNVIAYICCQRLKSVPPAPIEKCTTPGSRFSLWDVG